jgi:hypothetical protein
VGQITGLAPANVRLGSKERTSHISLLLRPRQQQREQLGAAFSVDNPIDEVGPEPPLKGDYRLLRIGKVVAEPLEGEQEAGVGPVRVDQLARGAWKRQPPLRQRMPREELARIFLARWDSSTSR